MHVPINCKICGKPTANNNGLISHVSQIHGLSSKAYYDLYYKSDLDGICAYCGKPTRFIKFGRGYSRFCSRSCTALGTVLERKQIRYNKYGEGHYFSVKGADTLRKQAKATAKRRFANIVSDAKLKYHADDSIINISQIDAIKQKVHATAQRKYGVNNTFMVKTNTGTSKRIITCLSKYGVQSPLQNKQILSKVIATCFKKYGYSNPLKSPYVRQKISLTNIAKYGVPVALNNPEIRHKSWAKYIYDNQAFDSSWELAYYIYLTDKHIRFKFHSTIFKYYSPTDNKYHNYECDFTLFNKTYVEIKGTHLLKNMKQNVHSKEYYKYLCMLSHNVHIIDDVNKYISYVKDKYGKHYLHQFKITKRMKMK